jgi:hypothetical protein
VVSSEEASQRILWIHLEPLANRMTSTLPFKVVLDDPTPVAPLNNNVDGIKTWLDLGAGQNEVLGRVIPLAQHRRKPV